MVLLCYHFIHLTLNTLHLTIYNLRLTPSTPFCTSLSTITGTGAALLDNSSQYNGKFRYGLFHGKGRFTWPDGVSYDGDFEQGDFY